MESTPKAIMLLNTLRENLTDLSTECWTDETHKKLKQIEAELATLEVLIIKENK